MARQDAVSITIDGSTAAKLNEIQAGNIESLVKLGNSFKVKSNAANLSEPAGSYNFKRFRNSAVKTYGTARTAGHGDKLVAPEITVNVDKNQEIVEEARKFDIMKFGADNAVLSVVKSRQMNFLSSQRRDIEESFWNEAYLGALGDSLSLSGSVVAGIGAAGTTPVDEYIDTTNFVPLETVKNNYVNGVDRDVIACMLSPKAYSKLKSRTNTMFNTNFGIDDKEISGINGVAVFNEMYLPKKVESITLVKGAVAQPLLIGDGLKCENVPISGDIAIEYFYDYGTKTLSGDLIVVGIECDATHTAVSKVATLPVTANTTAVPANMIFVTTADSTGYNSANAISGTNYPKGTMFTGTVSGTTITWTQYNV